MRVPRRPALALAALALSAGLTACSDDDVAQAPGGPQEERVGEDQAPAVRDDTGETDGVGGSTTGDADQVEPSPSG